MVRTRRNFDLPPQNESILNLYENLLAVTKNATESSTKNIIAHLSNIVDQCSTEYNNNTIRDIDNAISRANTTINSIISTSQENLTINITTLCTIPDLKAISEKLKRDSFNEINEVIMYGLDSIYRRTIGNINFTRNEVLSVGLQIEECTSITDCYYFTQKNEHTENPDTLGDREN
ncbi:hypothetical protein NQ314_013643 [Rhamnusium bicolor]|uniref:Uncharacterized protein n=1 Tax=Rhamnusium bicolor TaxID=1586634 RepID=A0AAV8X5X9_9CUCU|nr:hypothetical protein NQ314_013643 [Rhamnusium bicolor]